MCVIDGKRELFANALSVHKAGNANPPLLEQLPQLNHCTVHNNNKIIKKIFVLQNVYQSSFPT